MLRLDDYMSKSGKTTRQIMMIPVWEGGSRNQGVCRLCILCQEIVICPLMVEIPMTFRE